MATGSGKSKLLAKLTFDNKRLAQLAEAAGDREKAARHAASAGLYRDAARLFAEAGKKNEAVINAFRAVLGKKADAGKKSGPLQAAEMLLSAGYQREASHLFELGGRFHQAAKSALRSGQTARAGFLYDRAKQWTKAATAYEKAGQLDDAVRVLDLEARRLRGEIGGQPAQATASRRHQVERKRAELLARVGKSTEAARVMREAASTGASGESLERAGKSHEAIDAYVEARRYDDALRVAQATPGIESRRVPAILRQAGRMEEAAKMFAAHGFAEDAAQAYEAVDDWTAAARQWQTARQPLRAAQALERGGRLSEAAKAYGEAGDHDRAAEVWVRAGDDAQAAACWAEAGRHDQAATAYLRSRRFLSAADQFLAADARAEAMQCLRQIPADDVAYAKGNLLLAKLSFEDGKLEDALHRLRLLPVDAAPTSALGRDRLYFEGRCLEALRRPEEARVRYEQLLAQTEAHRDAQARLADLDALAQGATTAATVAASVRAAAAGPPATSALTEPMGAVPRPVADGAEAADSTVLALGSVLAERYEILEEIGHGGMGRVYRANDRMLGGAVAVKTVLAPRAGSPEEARLLREVQICRKITHPNIVRVHDVGRFAGGLFVTMELLSGKSLYDVLRRRGRLGLAQVRTIVGQTAGGLAEAHELGVVHRDLKPGNIFITDRHVKLLDFGIARMASEETRRLTQTGSAVGSPHYMSPEQLRGGEVDGRADLYALGVVAYTLIAGHEPYRGETIANVALAHLEQPIPDLRDERPEVPAAWAMFVSGLLAKDAADRPQSAEEVRTTVVALPKDGAEASS